MFALLQALSSGSVACQHAEDAEVTAVCCLTCTDNITNVVVTATTTPTGTTKAVHLNFWHPVFTQPQYDEEGQQTTPETTAANRLMSVTTEHPDAIISMCAVPFGSASSTGAAFVTCSKGTTSTAGEIRLWTSEGGVLPMTVNVTSTVVVLDYAASVSKVIITVNKQGHTLIAACCTACSAVQIWNTTTGAYQQRVYTGMPV
jgi:WD40 repeat protein